MKIVNSQKGFMLVEALLSVVILSVSITLIIQAMTSSLRAMVYNSRYTMAMILIENKMLDLIDQTTIADNWSEEERFHYPDEKFSYAVTSRKANQSEALSAIKDFSSQLNKVELAVSWNTRNKQKSVQIDTFLFGED